MSPQQGYPAGLKHKSNAVYCHLFQKQFCEWGDAYNKKIIVHLYIQLKKPIFTIYIGDLSALCTHSDNSRGKLIPTEYWYFSWEAQDISLSIAFGISKIKINVCV